MSEKTHKMTVTSTVLINDELFQWILTEIVANTYCKHTHTQNNKIQSSEWTRQSGLKLNMVYLNKDNDSVGVTWVNRSSEYHLT